VIQLAGQFVPVKVNAEKEGVPVAKKYGVHGFPTILFLNAAGEIEGKIGGYMPPGPFGEELKRIAQAHKDFPQLQARLKANAGDAEAAAKLAAIFAARGDDKRAGELVAQAEKTADGAAKLALAQAYNALADYYQGEEKYDRAVPLFRKALALAAGPRETAYARLSIAVCFLSQDKKQEAIPELEAVVKQSDAPADMKKEAQDLLSQLKGNPRNR
jgi:tetratricopeptide (TPR) repeat protein